MTGITVLANPAARGGRGMRRLAPVLARLRATGLPVSVVSGASPGDTLEQARAAVRGRPSTLVACGGDGLVHLAVQAVAGTGVPLAIIPMGTGNDIAADLGVPRDPLRAADLVTGGVPRVIDAATAGDRWFAGVLACGFDSRVNERANAMTGPAKYVIAALQELREFQPIPFRITVDDGPAVEVEAMMVAVGNTRSYGNGMKICPTARPDDGLLDVVVLKAVSKAAFLRTFPKVFLGAHTKHPAVEIHRAVSVTLEAPGVIAYADGERVGPTPLTCTARAGALTVMTRP
ncbi:diacylglycerol/lipid kinase family protein [Herbidospora mongoliensis]|uniref:diacylglycerol/lipid kinase family protein n=1 Tax=Herbidospora mongoliensis TaxID=688067 RepID=UPI000A024000|nr:YegS/Rv2252/BmrU family lipid kinase [Herbidospora mongoliensis]